MSSSLNAQQRRRVEQAQPMVERLAAMMAPRMRGVSRDELCSAGYEALVRCGLRYDPEMGVTFRTYAYTRVRGAMLDAGRRALPGLRRRSRAVRALQATQALLEQQQEREQGPDPRTLEQRVAAAADLVASATAAVMLATAGPRDPERVVDLGRDPEAALDDVKVRERLREVVERTCSDEDKALIDALYDEGTTLTELAERLGKHKSTVSRRHAALLRRLAASLAE